MARSPKRKSTLPQRKRRRAVAESGLVPLTKHELRALGFSESSRRFKYAGAPGKLTRENTVSRRQAEQPVIAQPFERLAAFRAAVSGGRTQNSRYTWFRAEYIATHPEWEGRVGALRSDPEFRRLYHGFATSRNKSASGPIARALVAIGRRNPEWTFNVGDSPKR